MSVRVAGIDCGTNSIRLMIADVDDNGMRLVTPRRMQIVRLGQDIDTTHRFNPEALERTYNAVREFAEVIARHDVDAVRFVATSATRDAEDKDVFEAEVESILGVRPDVISGVEEATLSFLGATSALEVESHERALVVDLGGGSTEIVAGVCNTFDNPIIGAYSMNIGSVRMSERYDLSGYPAQEDVIRAVQDINRHIDQAFSVVDISEVDHIIGVSGTVTTMSALALGLSEYRRELIDGANIAIQQAVDACHNIVYMTHDQRAAIPVIHPGRVDVIAGGALIWQCILQRVAEKKLMKNLDISSYIASEHGLLDGIVLHLGKSMLQ